MTSKMALVQALNAFWRLFCSQYNTKYTPGEKYRVRINHRMSSLRHNLSRKCSKIVTFVSITHRERNIWNGPTVGTTIGNITQDMIDRVWWREWEYRLDTCRVTRGAHIECI
jgi:hypothetical protein